MDELSTGRRGRVNTATNLFTDGTFADPQVTMPRRHSQTTTEDHRAARAVLRLGLRVKSQMHPRADDPHQPKSSPSRVLVS